MPSTVVGLFDDRDEAQNAVRDLIQNGFTSDQVSMVASDPEGKMRRYDTDDEGNLAGEGAATGAVSGAVVGGALGLLIGAGIIFLPVGVLAAGPIAGLLTGAVAGMAAGGLLGALIGLGIPKDEAEVYAEGVRRGGTLVTVRANNDTEMHRAHQIMDRDGAVDIEERAAAYRQEGFTAYDPNAAVYTEEQARAERERYRMANRTATTETTTSGMATNISENSGTGMGVTTDVTRRDRDIDMTDQPQRLEVVQEELQVGKRQVERGGVRVRSYMTEQPVQEQVNLREEHVVVNRNPVDRPVDADAVSAFQEGTIEMRETAEVPVVQKEARVVEEVEIGKEATQRTETVQDTVRQTHVDVEQVGGQTAGMGTGMADRLDFRSDFDQRYAGRGYTYEEYEPAYRYGHGLSSNQDMANQDWSVIEPRIRQDWEGRNPGTWERFKDAIRGGWEYNRTRTNRARMM